MQIRSFFGCLHSSPGLVLPAPMILRIQDSALVKQTNKKAHFGTYTWFKKESSAGKGSLPMWLSTTSSPSGTHVVGELMWPSPPRYPGPGRAPHGQHGGRGVQHTLPDQRHLQLQVRLGGNVQPPQRSSRCLLESSCCLQAGSPPPASPNPWPWVLGRKPYATPSSGAHTRSVCPVFTCFVTSEGLLSHHSRAEHAVPVPATLQASVHLQLWVLAIGGERVGPGLLRKGKPNLRCPHSTDGTGSSPSRHPLKCMRSSIEDISLREGRESSSDPGTHTDNVGPLWVLCHRALSEIPRSEDGVSSSPSLPICVVSCSLGPKKGFSGAGESGLRGGKFLRGKKEPCHVLPFSTLE